MSFIKEFLRDSPVSETNSIYTVVTKINQNPLFVDGKSLTYYFLKKLISKDINQTEDSEEN